MSLVTLIRDYVDVANSTENLDGYTLSSLAYHTIIFLFTVAKQAIVYCFTFHWLRDLTYFCFTPPLILSSFANVGEFGKLIGETSSPLSHLLAFSDWNLSTGVGILFLGFFNGCFSCLHLSAAHLITIRRMLVQGVPAGLCSAFGTAIGQLVFLASIFFGFRGLLFPWLALEPLQFLVGTGIVLSVASTMAQDRRTPTIQWSAKSSLFLYICTNAALAWCEQAAIFQWMGNFSLGAEPTFLETTPSLGLVINLAKQVTPLVNKVATLENSTNQAASLVERSPNFFSTLLACAQNLSYLFAFFLGSVLGAVLIAFFLQRFLESVLRYKKIAVYYGLVKQANLPLATLIFAFGFGSMPYYGFDYLVTKGFGFIPQEHFFKQTLFSPINLVSKTSQAKDSPQSRLEDQLALFFTLEGERSKSFAVDTTPFDDGQYLKTSQKRPQAFEDLNYRGEHLWTNRLSRISNIREQANQTQSSFLGPIFSWMRSFLWGDEPGSILTNRLPSSSRYTRGASEMHHAEQEEGVTPRVEGRERSAEAIGNRPTEGIKVQESERAESVSPELLQSSRTPQHTNSFLFSDLENNRKKEFSSEMEENDNYLKEFDKQFDKGFSNFYHADPPSLIEVEDQWQEKRIKEKCYKNPIYKFLLNTEIDTFLARQPHSHWLSPEEEILLLKRRQVLGNYYDTLALTNQVSKSSALEQLVPKSYANTIYNHQFKGTLKVARRLFSIKRASAKKAPNSSAPFSTESMEGNTLRVTPSVYHAKQEGVTPNPSNQVATQNGRENDKKETRVVKFDQPLFLNEKECKNTRQILFHEELSDKAAGSNSTMVAPSRLGLGAPPSGYTLAPHGVTPPSSCYTRAPSVLEDGVTTRVYHHAEQEGGVTDENIEQEKLLLEQAESSPLYAGWDEQLRKFIVTNKYQNRTLAGYTFSEYPERSPDNRNGESVTVFTTWPIPNPLIDNVNLISLDQKEFNSNSGVASESDSPSAIGDVHLDAKERIKSILKPSLNIENSRNYSKNEQEPSSIYTPPSSSYAPGTRYTRGVTPPVYHHAEQEKGVTPSPSVEEGVTSVHDKNQMNPRSGLKFENNLNGKAQSAKRSEKSTVSQNINHLSLRGRSKETKSFLFQSKPVTNDMVNALLQWQKLIKENKPQETANKQVAKEKISYWPDNIRRANWSNELVENDMEFDEPAENAFKKKTLLWEFTPPYHGGFVWSGTN